MQAGSLILDIVPGGELKCVVPRTAEDRSAMFAAVVGVSMLRGCDLVMVRHWLPGVHLFVQAAHDLPVNAPTPHLCTEWLRLQSAVMAWLDGDGPLVVQLPTAYGLCHLASDRTPLRFDEVAYTFSLQWRLPSACMGQTGTRFVEVKPSAGQKWTDGTR